MESEQNNSEELYVISDEVVSLEEEKKSAWNWQERRHPDWTENYLLYRDKVFINRLTQRQSVNIPLMKTSIKTALKEVDDPPLLYFQNLSNDQEKEIFYNEYFNYCAEKNKLTIKDIVDKKQVFLYGRSFKKLNIVDGTFFFEIIDPHDILVQRNVDPTDINSARYICHQHIFVPISVLCNNEYYDQDEVARLKSYMATSAGILKADSNLRTLNERNDRMRYMGVTDVDNPRFGETYVELNEHYVKKWDDNLGEEVFYITVTAEGRNKLMSKSLEEHIGKTSDNFWRYNVPITSWGDDIEQTDFWSDGMADTIRTPNKILNSWLSQLVENRTLRNFGMNFYDATIEGFTPQTTDPVPGGWVPLPGKPSDVYARVDIPELSESIDEMNFVMQIAEKATAATSIQQGVSEQRKITLGEVQILMANAKERIKSVSVFYIEDWKEFGRKYIKMLEAAHELLDGVTLHKKGLHNEKMYPYDVNPDKWIDKVGYTCKVLSRSEKEEEDINMLQKLNGVRSSMPDNQPLMRIYQKKMLEFIKLTPEEVKEVLDFEMQKARNPIDMMNGNMPVNGMMNRFPAPQGMMQQPRQLPIS